MEIDPTTKQYILGLEKACQLAAVVHITGYLHGSEPPLTATIAGALWLLSVFARLAIVATTPPHKTQPDATTVQKIHDLITAETAEIRLALINQGILPK